MQDGSVEYSLFATWKNFDDDVSICMLRHGDDIRFIRVAAYNLKASFRMVQSAMNAAPEAVPSIIEQNAGELTAYVWNIISGRIHGYRRWCTEMVVSTMLGMQRLKY